MPVLATDWKLDDNIGEPPSMSEDEGDYVRRVLNSPRPAWRRTAPGSPRSVLFPPQETPPPFRREKADDIVEAAMRLMDLAMDQNRLIKKMEKIIEENYSKEN